MDKLDHELKNIAEKVEALPIEEIIGGEIELYGGGSERDALCPFHNDRHIGSFKVNINKNIWKCFSCGEGGPGGVTFYQKLHGLSYMEAVKEVGLKYHVITNTEAALFPKDASSTKVVTPMHFHPVMRQNPKLPAEILDKVYRAFISVCPQMTGTFKQKLMKERFLEEEDLIQFFKMPRYSACFMALFYRKLEENGLQRDVLKNTPGFYYDTRYNLFKFLDPGENALGIISYDADGKINGIQIRKDTDDKKKRYIWFSSGFADGSSRSPYCINGTTNSQVIDVLWGTKLGILACTEGKFKAIKLQRKLGYTTLNMHGVTSWPADKVIRFAKDHKFQTVLLCYDADIAQNDSVARAAVKFSKKLSLVGISVKYLTWKITDGKGIDDLINFNPTSYQEKISIRDGFDFNHSVLTPLIEAAG